MTTVPGRPSVGTMLCFLLVETAGVLTIFVPASLLRCLPLLGWSVVLLGAVAVAGYAIDIPTLYYPVTTLSTAMAVHTAILFILLGGGLVLTTGMGSWRTTA